MRRATLAKLCLTSAAACAAGALWSPPAAADTKGAFRSHEARYAVTAAADAKAGLGVDGQLMVRLQATCRGWQQKQALILRITTPDDSELAMSSASQLAEAYDGSTLAYQDETRINDEQPKVTRARATRPTPGAGVTLTVEGDSDDVGRKQLPPETIFTGEHSKRLIAAAAAGLGQYSATVVDGTFTKGYVVSAFIAKARPAPRGTYSGPAFPDATVWPMRLGYFPLGEAAGEPEFEASAQIGASGIAAELLIEQAGLKLKATLVGLKLLEPEGC